MGIAAGQRHSAFLSDKGRIWCCGSNKHGQCHSGEDTDRIYPEPHLVDNLPALIFEQLHCGWSFTVAVSRCYRVVGFGRGDFGQLAGVVSAGTGPRVIASDVVQLAAGSEHCIALDRDGHLLSWGWNEHGSCGISTTENVSAGLQHSHAAACNELIVELSPFSVFFII